MPTSITCCASWAHTAGCSSPYAAPATCSGHRITRTSARWQQTASATRPLDTCAARRCEHHDKCSATFTEAAAAVASTGRLIVNVNAVTASAGLCVSRYDVTLYSHVAASLPHTSAPVLLQVELLHKGGLAGGAPAEHADAVTKSVLESVDQFAARIKTANQ